MNKRFAAALAGGACLLSANPAFAGTAATTIDVSAIVRASCALQGGNQLAFGALDGDRNNSTYLNLEVKCNTGQNVSMSLTSLNGASSFQMVDGQSNRMVYSVRVNNTDRLPGQSFSISGNATHTFEAGVSGYEARNSVAGTYTDRLYVNVDY